MDRYELKKALQAVADKADKEASESNSSTRQIYLAGRADLAREIIDILYLIECESNIN
jgi:hypothetical protein